MREWAERSFELYPEKGYESVTLTCVKNSKGVDVAGMISRLEQRGYTISNGYGKLKEETFRIAHMGDHKMEEVKELLTLIDSVAGDVK